MLLEVSTIDNVIIQKEVSGTWASVLNVHFQLTRHIWWLLDLAASQAQ